MKKLCLFAFILCSYSTLAEQSTEDIARNKALIESLKKNPFGRNRELKLLPRGNEQTPLLISLPEEGLQPKPVLYVVLDGRPATVAGLEYEHDYPYSNAIIVGVASSNRIRDYSSKLRNKERKEDLPSFLKISPPAGDEFVAHLATEIVPYLEKNYGPFAVKILVGASLGGITTLDTFLSYPNSFDAYGALDPSLWYNYDYYTSKIELLAQTPESFKNKCLIMTGSEDEPELSAAARNFDRLLSAFSFPSSFRYAYRRLTELEHIQSIRVSTMFVTPFVLGIADIVPDDDLKGLSIAQFESKLEVAWRAKTCLKNPTMNELNPLYGKFLASLVKEERFDDALAVYDKVRSGSPLRTLRMLQVDSAVWGAFAKLSQAQKGKLAKDYNEAYPQVLKLMPSSVIHLVNHDLAVYAPH